jgi:hypothetical protein
VCCLYSTHFFTGLSHYGTSTACVSSSEVVVIIIIAFSISVLCS